MIAISVDFQQLFEALPGNYVVLQPNAPHYTILAMSDELLHTTANQRRNVVGKSVFEVFPENPEAVTATGPSSFRLSLENAIQHKKYDQMPVIRYDLPVANGEFEERYWSAGTKPVLNAAGEVIYMIHTNVDVTERIKAEKKQSALRKIEKTYNLFMQAPVSVCIVSGPENIVELANEEFLQILGRTSAIIGKPLFEALPEAKDQGFPELMHKVRKTGEPFYATEHPASLIIDGKEQLRYYNFVYSPYFENLGDKAPTGVFVVAHDVTEGVIARKKLEENEQKFRNVVEQASDLIGIFRGEDLLVEVANDALLEVWQVGQEALNKPFADVVPGIREQGFIDLLLNVLHTGEPFYGYETPAVFKRKSGVEETVYFNFSYQPYREKDNTISGVLVIASDVTEQITVKQQLVESEHRLRNMVKQLPVAFTLTRGYDIIIENINAPMLQILGKSHTEEQVIGKKMTEVLPEIIGQPILGIVYNVLDTGEAFRGNEVPVTLLVEGKQEEHFFNISYTPLIEDGKVTGVLHVAINVTEQVVARKKIEESREALKRFQFMADNARDPFVLTSEDSTFAYLNKKALQEWGYTEEEAKHLKVPDVDPIYQEEIFAEVFSRAQKEIIPQFETLHKKKDGNSYPVEVNMGGLTVDGQPYLFAVTRDITERKRMEETIRQSGADLQRKVEERTAELEAANNELKRSNQNLEEFAYAASHDMKEPIRKIHFFGERLKSTFGNSLSEEQSRYFERMETAAKRMSTLIDDLLLYSHISRGANLEEMVHLNEVLLLVQEDLELETEEKRAVIKVDAMPAIKGHKRQLQQLFQNLIGNALKYSKPDLPPEVTITCQRINGAHTALHLNDKEGGKEYHRIQVSDNGIGFDQEDAERIFNVFTRLHGMAEYKGTGVGLSIVRKVVENHGGTIAAESTPEKGATFTIYLPVL